jgi:hypothetical protein
MNVGYLVGSIVFFLFSLGCIGNTVVDMAQGRYRLSVGNLLPALIVHVGTAVVGVYLLSKVRRVGPQSGKGAKS